MKKLNSLTNKIATVALAGAIALSSAGVIAATAAVTDPQPAHAANAGWQKSGNRWWYQYSNKSYATGWEKVGNTWYYFYNDGWMAANGWQKVGGNWFWLESSGAMRESSWLQVNGTWYYLKAGGYMATGWQKVGGKWYYLDGSGAMATSRWVGNYYVDKNGVMATNTWVGSYYVDDSGAWVPNAKPTTSTNNGSSTNATKTKVWVVDEPACDIPIECSYQFTKCSGTYKGVRNGCQVFFGISPDTVEKELANKVYASDEWEKAYEVGEQTVKRLRSEFTYVAKDGNTYKGSLASRWLMIDHGNESLSWGAEGLNHGGHTSRQYTVCIGKIHYPEEGHWEYR